MRILAILSVIMFFYLVFQVLQSPPSLHVPGDKLLQMTKDPNLERMSLWYEWYGSLVTVL
jgi:hypothetical protein